MTEEERDKLIRVGAIALLRLEIPTAPAGAANEASSWWEQAKTVIAAIEPHWNSLLS